MLNAADWICTSVLLRTGRFFEANPLAKGFAYNASWGFVMKIALPIVIIMLMYRLIGSLDESGLRASQKAIGFGIGVYMALCSVHIVNFFLLPLISAG